MLSNKLLIYFKNLNDFINLIYLVKQMENHCKEFQDLRILIQPFH